MHLYVIHAQMIRRHTISIKKQTNLPVGCITVASHWVGSQNTEACLWFEITAHDVLWSLRHNLNIQNIQTHKSFYKRKHLFNEHQSNVYCICCSYLLYLCQSISSWLNATATP